MTNFESWHYYMKDVVSPESFITMSYYSMISAALQRRVYLGSDERPLFPNLYIILVADPGIGKGEALKPISKALSYHKLEKFKVKVDKASVESMNTQEQADAMAALLAEMEVSNGKEVNGSFKKLNSLEEPLLFPIAPDASSYEALVRTHAQSIRSIFPTEQKNSRLLKSGLYTHSSLTAVLEEMSSLCRRHQEDLMNYLIKTFDCGDHTYNTIGRGKDRVVNSCLNLLAGTTPAFMRESFDTKLLGDGFASRVVFVYEEKNRFYRFDSSSLTDDQIAAKDRVIKQLGDLGRLFGRASYSPEAYEFMKDYIEVRLGENRERLNPDPKLLHYYSRKNIHVQKLILAMHFSENLTYEIQVSTCKAAVDLLERLEEKMHLALNVVARNPMLLVANKVLKNWPDGSQFGKEEIWAKNFGDIKTGEELEAMFSYLLSEGKIRINTKTAKYEKK